jgi:hypothetical protein
MASTVLAPYTSATIVVPASSAIAVWSATTYVVLTQGSFANYPTPVPQVAFNAAGAYTSSVYTVATTVTIQAGGSPLYYNVGTGPVVNERPNYQGTPGTLNATGTLTAALMQSGIVTSTTAAAVAATTDTAALIDAASTFAVGDSFEFAVINTGGTNAFTVSGGTGVTLVGSGAVALSSSARFRVLKTAATPTFSVYRVA